MNMLRLIPLLTVPVLACATEPGGDITGQWNFSESRTASTGFTCEVTGDVLLNQATSGNFTGGISRAATCVDAPEGFEASLGTYQNILNGNVSDLDVSFHIDFCDYEGTLAEPNMSGTFECDIEINGESVDFTGTWQAVRVSAGG